jgi:hypothetical protein
MRIDRLLTSTIFIVLMLAACSSAAPAAVTDAPTTAPTLMLATNTLAPTTESTNTPVPVAQLQPFPKSNCCSGKTIEAGAYELPSWVGIPLTLEVGEGWQVVNEEAARLFMLGKGESIFNDPTQALVFIAIPNGNPQAILASIKNEKGLTPEDEITETTIAGFPGLQLNLSAKPNPGYEGDKGAEIPPGVQFLPSVNKYFTQGFLWTTWTAESRLRFIVLNVDEHTLLIEIDSPPTEFGAFASAADQVLQTLALRR